MSKSLRLTLPLLAVATMLVGWSIQSAMAQGAAKGKVTVTVKDAEGALAANVQVALLKGNVPLPAGGGGRRGQGGGGGGAPGGGGGAPPASQPAPLMTGATNDKGVFTFEGVDAGEYTIFAGRIGGGRRGQGGGGGGAPGGGGGAPPGGGAGGPPAGARGRGSATGTLEAGKELQLNIQLQAGGRGGQGGGGRNGGGAPGGAPAAPGAGA